MEAEYEQPYRVGLPIVFSILNSATIEDVPNKDVR